MRSSRSSARPDQAQPFYKESPRSQVVAPVESMPNLARVAGGVLRELRGVVGYCQNSLQVAEDGVDGPKLLALDAGLAAGAFASELGRRRTPPLPRRASVATLVRAFHLVRAQACHQPRGTRSRLCRRSARVRRLDPYVRGRPLRLRRTTLRDPGAPGGCASLRCTHRVRR